MILGWLTSESERGLNFLRKLIYWKLSTTPYSASTSSFPSIGALPTLKRPYILSIATWIKSSFPGWNKLSLPGYLFTSPPNQPSNPSPSDLDPSLITMISSPDPSWVIYLAPFQPGKPENQFHFLVKDLSSYYKTAQDGRLSYTANNGYRLSIIISTLIRNPRVSLQLPDSIPDAQVNAILMETLNNAPLPFNDLLSLSAIETTLRDEVLQPCLDDKLLPNPNGSDYIIQQKGLEALDISCGIPPDQFADHHLLLNLRAVTTATHDWLDHKNWTDDPQAARSASARLHQSVSGAIDFSSARSRDGYDAIQFHGRDPDNMSDTTYEFMNFLYCSSHSVLIILSSPLFTTIFNHHYNLLPFLNYHPVPPPSLILPYIPFSQFI